MITIKDVAEHAGVSIGTVSNVVNGKKVQDDLRVKVEQAIRALNYVPHAAARNLKISKTNNVAIVLPNLIDFYLVEFLMYSEKLLREKGYSTSLYITHGDPEVESNAIWDIQQHNFDGAILYSCQEVNSPSLKRLLRTEIQVVFLEREITADCNFIGADNYQAALEVVKHLYHLGHRQIALIANNQSRSDQSLRAGYCSSLQELGLVCADTMMKAVEDYKEEGFKELFRLLQMEVRPTAVIVGGKKMAEGVLEATAINNLAVPEDLALIVLSERNWLKYNPNLLTAIERPVEEISKAACNILFESIHAPKMYEPRKHYVRSALVDRGSCVEVKPQPKALSRGVPAETQLNVLLLKTSASYALRSLLPNFRNQHRIDIQIEMLKIDDLQKVSEQELKSKSAAYDIFMVDIPWLPSFVQTDSILDITDWISDDKEFISDYIEGIFESYCSYNGQIYGLPFMPGAQILFYRKDLLNDRDLKRFYNREYNTELRVPKNWVEFNTLARFFTKEYNPEAPTLYGTTMAAKTPVFITNEFCSRKWAYKARAFDEFGNVVINSSEALNAVKNFIQSYAYAPPWVMNNAWDEEIDDFCSGKCATMIQYESHSTKIVSQINQGMKNSIGYDIVPGGHPLLGGWSLVINKNSEKTSQAQKFIKWACGPEIAIMYSILGGTTARKSFYTNSDLNLLYPWLPVALKSYKLARQRSSPYRGGPTILQQNAYQDILGEALKKVILKQISPEESLEIMQKQLTELVRAK